MCEMLNTIVSIKGNTSDGFKCKAQWSKTVCVFCSRTLQKSCETSLSWCVHGTHLRVWPALDIPAFFWYPSYSDSSVLCVIVKAAQHDLHIPLV